MTEWANKKWFLKKNLQSLVGSLLWLCQVLPQGRPFIQRFIKAQESIRNKHHHVRIKKAMIADIRWWDNMVKKWPGTYLMEDQLWVQPDVDNLYTDASNIGAGATFRNYFTAFKWVNHDTITSHDIQKRELLTTFVAIRTFAPLWTRKKLIIWMDNMANTEAYYAGFCKNSEINRIIAQIYEVQIQMNFSLKIEHIPGIQNSDADLLSRSGHKEYLTKNPVARFLQPDIPTEYTNTISTIPSLLQ